MNYFVIVAAFIVYLSFGAGILLISSALKGDKKIKTGFLFGPILVGFLLGVFMLITLIATV